MTTINLPEGKYPRCDCYRNNDYCGTLVPCYSSVEKIEKGITEKVQIVYWKCENCKKEIGR